MKKTLVIFVLLVLAICIKAEAHQRMLAGVSTKDFSGVKPLGGSTYFYALYYTERGEGKQSKYIIDVLNDTLGMSKRIELNGDRQTAVQASCFNGNEFLLVFTNKDKKTRIFLTVDMRGDTVKKYEESNVPQYKLQENTLTVFQAMPDNFMLVSKEEAPKSGYSIKVIDKELNTKWEKSYVSDKALSEVIEVQQHEQNVFVLRKQTEGKKVGYLFDIINAMDGSQMFSSELKDEEGNTGIPSFMNVKNGMIIVGGIYTAGEAKNSNGYGLFFAMYGPGGDLQTFARMPWSTLKGKMKPEQLAGIIDGKTRIVAEDMVRTMDGRLVIVTEATTAGKNSNEMKLGDILLFYFRPNGEFEKAERIESIAKEATIKGPVTSATPEALNSWLSKEKFFSYKGIVRYENKDYLVHDSQYGGGAGIRLYPLSGDAPALADIEMQDWMQKSMKSNKGGKAGNDLKRVYDSSPYVRDEDAAVDLDKYSEAIPLAGQNTILLYNFDRPNLKIWTAQPGPATVK